MGCVWLWLAYYNEVCVNYYRNSCGRSYHFFLPVNSLSLKIRDESSPRGIHTLKTTPRTDHLSIGCQWILSRIDKQPSASDFATEMSFVFKIPSKSSLKFGAPSCESGVVILYTRFSFNCCSRSIE